MRFEAVHGESYDIGPKIFFLNWVENGRESHGFECKRKRSSKKAFSYCMLLYYLQPHASFQNPIYLLCYASPAFEGVMN